VINLLLDNHYFNFSESDTFIANIISSTTNADIVSHKKIDYINIPCAFDIETSSFYENDEKKACCYLWQFGFNGKVIIGRSLFKEFVPFINKFSVSLNLSISKRVICYVHNLTYEFQWIRKYFIWQDLMANKIRQPFKVVSTIGIEYRCSYILSGYSLAKVAENLQYHKIKKLVENMNYDIVRHSKTKLTTAEIDYAVNDVLIVMAYIDEELNNVEGGIWNIPLTNTSRVRRYIRNNSYSYRKKVHNMTLTADSYTAAKKAFSGGFTHANSKYTGVTLYNVGSYDFTSSYPYVMISEKFPISSLQFTVIQGEHHLKQLLNFMCCIFQITFYDIYSIANENFISYSRCENVINPVTDNGRIFSANELTTTITEIDFKIILETYKFSDIKIGYFYSCRKGYLPLQFINDILQLYKNKTELKGVKGKEIEYLTSKGMINSCYGMCVTDIIREEFLYNNENSSWFKQTPNIYEKIEDYNNDYGRFLYYIWGVYVTAYARYNLISTIIKLGNDYVYSDTDSIKFLNVEKNTPIFESYNQSVVDKLKKVSNERNIDFELFQPKNKKGKSKLIGIFDFEGLYNGFKTLGAKRYIYTDSNNEYHITVAGVNKKTGVKMIHSFDDFKFNMVFNAEYCGKLTHTYIDEEISGIVTDFNGVSSEYHELSCIHLEKTTYEMTISNDYELFLNDIEHNYIYDY
jgi:hypothetical protein